MIFFEGLAERDPEMSTKGAEEKTFVWFLVLSETTRKRDMKTSTTPFLCGGCVRLLLVLGEHPPRTAEPEFVVKRASNQTALVKEGCALKVSLPFLEIEILVPAIELDDIKLRYMKVRAFLAD